MEQQQVVKGVGELPSLGQPRDRRKELARDIATVINRYSRENRSHTPDFVLAEYLVSCLEAFEAGSNAREKWYGRG